MKCCSHKLLVVGGIFDAVGSIVALGLLVPFLPHVLPVARMVELLVNQRLRTDSDGPNISTWGGSVVMLNPTSTTKGGIQVAMRATDSPAEQDPEPVGSSEGSSPGGS